MNNNPFEDSPLDGADPRATELQEARDKAAAGQSAQTSLTPNYNELLELFRWMECQAEFTPRDFREALERPGDYWPIYQQSKGEQ